MLMGFQGIFPMNKQYIYYIFVYTFENVLICWDCRTFN